MVIKKFIVLIQDVHADSIIMVTDLIEAVWPYEENLAMSFKAAQGTGEEYLRTHFPGIEIEIIDLRNKNIKIPFSDLDRKQEE